MKIVHIISSLEMGGAQAVLFTIVSQFQEMGHEQVILYMHDGPYKKRFESLEIAVQQVTGIVSRFDPISFLRLVKLLRKIKPDCIHTVLWAANWLGRLAARLLSVPCINSLHNNYDQNGIVRMLFDRCVPYKKNVIISVSNEVKQSFCNQFPKANNVEVIHNGIDVEFLHNSVRMQKKSREELNLLPNHYVIGSVGRFHPIKRYDFLLEAFAILHAQFSQARLVLIGGGALEEALRVKAERLAISFNIRWIIDQPAQNYYPLFDCFTLSSEKEGISIALLEAMSFGIPPVVTYHSVQHPIIVNGQNGYVAQAGSVQNLATKIGCCIRYKEVGKKMGIFAQHTVHEKYDAIRMISAYSRLFHRVSSMQK